MCSAKNFETESVKGHVLDLFLINHYHSQESRIFSTTSRHILNDFVSFFATFMHKILHTHRFKAIYTEFIMRKNNSSLASFFKYLLCEEEKY